jgi:phosphatidate cytidylyltransferase
MKLLIDRELVYLFGAMTVALGLATTGGWALSRTASGETSETLRNLRDRVSSWWQMAAIFVIAVLIGSIGSVILFGFLSFLALREFITVTPTRVADHHTLFWCFFVITPLQYLLLGLNWYAPFTVLVPVYAFLLVPVRSALSGDWRNFLERVAKIQWGLMLCVYCVSHAPALLVLRIPGYIGQNAKLLLFLVAIDEVADVSQYLISRFVGKERVTPSISPGRSWEGLAGGAIMAVLLGAALSWATPFTPLQAAGMALAITAMTFAGAMTMGAIKSDRGITEYGTVLERVDSVCFTAPIFFHLTKYFFT